METSFDPPPATRTTRDAARMLERRSLGAKCCEEAVSMSVESAGLVCVRIGMTMLAFSSSSSTWRSRYEESPSAPGSTVAAKTLAAAPSAFEARPRLYEDFPDSGMPTRMTTCHVNERPQVRQTKTIDK